jgi:Sulfotransferase domain
MCFLRADGFPALQNALGILGYDGVYTLETLMAAPRDVELWERAMEAKFYGRGRFGREEWEGLFVGCEVGGFSF